MSNVQQSERKFLRAFKSLSGQFKSVAEEYEQKAELLSIMHDVYIEAIREYDPDYSAQSSDPDSDGSIDLDADSDSDE